MNDGALSAFPRLLELNASVNEYGRVEYTAVSSLGMTLRDYFAGQALGDLSCTCDPGVGLDPARVAGVCYALADAMLAEREK